MSPVRWHDSGRQQRAWSCDRVCVPAGDGKRRGLDLVTTVKRRQRPTDEEDCMAEIKVEPKRGMGWIWAVVAIIALALIAWLLFVRADRDPATTTPTTGAVMDAAPPVLI
jgi:hypothetical protein